MCAVGSFLHLFTLFRRIGGNVGYAFVTSQVEHRPVFHRVRLVDHVTPYDTATSQAAAFHIETIHCFTLNLPSAYLRSTIPKTCL